MRLLRFLPSRWWSWRSWKSWPAYVRWRLETYGVFYPDGRWHADAFRRMTRQFRRYYRWVGDLDRLKSLRSR